MPHPFFTFRIRNRQHGNFSFILTGSIMFNFLQAQKEFAERAVDGIFIFRRITWSANISFTYRFGKQYKTEARKNSGGDEDEMRRVNTTG